jgi:hypothetical protein
MTATAATLPLVAIAIPAAGSTMHIGMRVVIRELGTIGTVRHVGPCHWASGDFVGIQLGTLLFVAA